MIYMNNISKIYQAGDVETLALNSVSLKIEKGEYIAVMGPSGCGKSTFLNVLGMLDSPSEGSFKFLDEEVANYSESGLAAIRKQHIGFIFQSFNLVDELTVEENVALPLLYQNIPASERAQRVSEVLEKIAIAHRAKHRPQQLSGGQQQRVAVARAVVTRPELILADEPTGNLDSKNGQDVLNILDELNNEGTTIVMVTHDQSHADHAQRIIHLLDGSVVSENVIALQSREVSNA